MKLQDILKLSVSLIIIGAILYFLYWKGYFEIIYTVGVRDWVVLIALTLISYFISGFQMYYLVKHVNGIKLQMADVLFMPMSISLFAYFIPTNGGLLYSVYFLRKKYQLISTSGFSIGVFTIYISFIITGLAGLIASLFFEKVIIYLLLVSVLLIISPLLIYYFNKLFQKIKTREHSKADRIKRYLNDVVIQSNEIIKNRKVSLINILITFLSLFVLFLMYWYLNSVLNLELPVSSIIAIMILMRISSLIRIMPGNLGLEELFAAGIFGVIGKDPAAGLLFSVCIRFCSVLVMVPAGTFHAVFNNKIFSLRDLKKILRPAKTDNTAIE